MAIYAIHDQDPKFIFLINFKVMYSSLNKILPEYFPAVKFYYKNKAEKLKFSDYTKYAIVRNPYQRVISTYYDKCQRSPEDSLNQEKAKLQYCQHQLLNTIKEVRKENYDIAVPANHYTLAENAEERKLLNDNFELLKTINFEEYVECISIILARENVDGHFEKQYKFFDLLKQNPFYYPMKVFKKTNIFKLEDIDRDWNSICNKLGVEMSLRKINKMHHMRPNFKQLYTNEIRKTVAKIYKIDFVKFKYPIDL